MNDDMHVITEESRKKFDEISKDAQPFFIGHHINDKNDKRKEDKQDAENNK